MELSKIRIRQYRSFSDSDWVEFSPGLNVVVGENNSGKSALLSCISRSISNRPHVNAERYSKGEIGSSSAELTFKLTTSEVRNKLSATAFECMVAYRAGNSQTNLAELFSEDFQFEAYAMLHPNTDIGSTNPPNNLVISHDCGVALRMATGSLQIANTTAGVSDNLINVMTNPHRPSLFNFRAQRFGTARSPFQREEYVNNEVSNLAAVLFYLQSKRPGVFIEIEDRIREIVPGIDGITIGHESTGHLHIYVTADRKSRAEELFFSLEEVGTGVAQLLAIITTVVISDPSIIVIDEINSFLHPSAARKLLKICRTFYPSHQYIVSSHAPEVISFDGIDRLLSVARTGFTSYVESFDRPTIIHRREALRNLGVSMLDITGHNAIIWVEGLTEESCLPIIFQRLAIEDLEGVAVLKLSAASDFTRKGSTAKSVVRLYQNVTSAVAPLSIGCSFLLDRDEKQDSVIESIVRSCGNKLLFLERKNFESYLLSPTIISNVISAEMFSTTITRDLVKNKMEELARKPEFGAASLWKGDLQDERWLKKVDGAKLVSALFDELSDHQLSYNKVLHGARICSDISMEYLNKMRPILVKLVYEALQR